MFLESISGLLDGELPINFDSFVSSLFDQSQEFGLHLFQWRNATFGAETRENGDERERRRERTETRENGDERERRRERTENSVSIMFSQGALL
jgi:hypothetical protein